MHLRPLGWRLPQSKSLASARREDETRPQDGNSVERGGTQLRERAAYWPDGRMAEPIAHRFQLRIAIHTIGTRHCGNRSLSKRVCDEAVRVDKLTVETGAGVVLLRQRKKELARADRTRVNRKAGNYVVKHRGVEIRRIRAHQNSCLSNVHVITASSRSSSSAVAKSSGGSSISCWG